LSHEPSELGIDLYVYVGENPVSWSDPYGLSGWLTIYSESGGNLYGALGGHSWVSYAPDGGTLTTYGTWGNNPNGLGNGLHINLENPANNSNPSNLCPIANQCAYRTTYLNDAEQAQLYALIEQYKAEGPNAWSYWAPCSAFAADAWQSATGEKLNTLLGPTGLLGLYISDPLALKASIIIANGGQLNGTLKQPDQNTLSK
jgi:hypothetical protein